MNLSQNFTLEEMLDSATARTRKIENKPSPIQLQNLSRLCKDLLQPIRDKFGAPITVTSGFRSETLNNALRGSKTSQHLKGEAADIICNDNHKLWNHM